MNAQADKSIKPKEYEVLDAISQDSMITQSSLASHLGMAVGSVNWYIKRLINRGFVKVSHLDRTRLQYDLTPEGLRVLTQRAFLYMRDSLNIYNELREKAKQVLSELEVRGISNIYLDGNSAMIDILRLTCIERGFSFDQMPKEVVLKATGKNYQIVMVTSVGAEKDAN